MTQPIQFDKFYDVVIVGFGGAGASAARFAADNGAKVLLTEVAPLGKEGGNTHVSEQFAMTSEDYDAAMAYYKRTYKGFEIDPKVMSMHVKQLGTIETYFKKYLGIKKLVHGRQIGAPVALLPEFAAYDGPHKDGTKAFNGVTPDKSYGPNALWAALRHKVLERKDKIDIWLNSPALHLIQDPMSQAIIGVEIRRNHKKVRVASRKGVVLACGGFENNPEMIKNYLAIARMKTQGTVYNKGAGIKMAQEVGANIWHMAHYHSWGSLGGLSIDRKNSEVGRALLGWPELQQGSIFVAGDDGSRYMREDGLTHHGLMYTHGYYRMPLPQVHPYLIFDQHQYDDLKNAKHLPQPDIFDYAIKAKTVEELAAKTDLNSRILKQTISDFNHFVDVGRDYALNRDPKTMRKFDGQAYYAVPLVVTTLATAGGPKHDEHFRVVDLQDKPIPHLYACGELSSWATVLYSGGDHIAECLYGGKIAGENVAHEPNIELEESENNIDATTGASTGQENSNNDILAFDNVIKNIKLKPNEYIGTATSPIGGPLVVKIKVKGNQLLNVDVVKNNESKGIGSVAIDKLPGEMVKQNSYQVDAISGATVSSNTLKKAVKNALEKNK